MLNRLRSMVSQVFYTPVTATPSVTSRSHESNPFLNPFVQSSTTNTYAINKPVKGGYFAGYYNGQPNIVGRKLFIEV